MARIAFLGILAVLIGASHGETPSNFHLQLFDPQTNTTGGTQGIVQVFYDGEYGTRCNNHWDFVDALLVCKALGFIGVQNHAATLGEGLGDALFEEYARCKFTNFLSTVFRRRCSTSDYRRQLYRHKCDHSQDVAVVCREEPHMVRLVNGKTRVYGRTESQGRVEINHNGKWGTICDDHWSIEDANVVCKQLGYANGALVALGGATWGRGDGDILLDDVTCTGHESALTGCVHNGYGEHNCNHNEDAGVRCDDGNYPLKVRLVNGRTGAQGRVEIRLNGEWGTVCDNNWSIEDANVVCKQLGYENGASVALGGASWGRGEGDISLDEVKCNGDESDLSWCLHRGYGVHNCDHSDDAGVKCNDGQPLVDVRLVNGQVANEGRVELRIANDWGTLRGRDGYMLRNADVICRMLGFPRAAMFSANAAFGEGTGPTLLDWLECPSGREDTIDDCRHSTWNASTSIDHSRDFGIVCFLDNELPVPMRLVDGASPSEGRVELYFNGDWGTVCDDDWNLNDAHVICNNLGYNGALTAVKRGGFGPRPNGSPIHLYHTGCSGDETAIEECNHRGFGVTTCEFGEAAGVQCREWQEGDVRLLGASRSGVVQIYHAGAFGTICNDGWNLMDAKVVCKQLGYHNGVDYYGSRTDRRSSTTVEISDSDIIWMSKVKCVGYERSLSQCRFPGWGANNCVHAQDVVVGCHSYRQGFINTFRGSMHMPGMMAVG
ncbi:scavenger receptor cysteine-rich domain-containing protein DMBT1-like [Amphiura filiformis]|uniref:scavenger receptor cysteine-rich domain-containing protein DMBT1-like n=1 Tax=Amphiura filiformis TaxID=82378 RepID=UPI003B21B759